ncbi:MAG: KH domain-containing protein [Candidatus Bathyarchaeia archaeon]
MSEDYRIQALLRELKGSQEERDADISLPEEGTVTRKWQVYPELGYMLDAQIIQLLKPLLVHREGEGYAYVIGVEAGQLWLQFHGENLKRLQQLSSILERAAEGARDNLWEYAARRRVLAQLEKERGELTERFRSEIDAIYEHYSRARWLIRGVEYDVENYSFIVKVTAGREGYFIGKQGATIKPLQEKVGKRIQIVGV